MKRLTTIVLLFTIILMASAQKITAPQALEKARAFAQQRKPNESKGQKHKELVINQLTTNKLLSNIHDDELFLFNIGNGEGFVIVSGDERTPSILGYADSGSIDPQNMPENMRVWLEGYAHDIASLQPGVTVLYAAAAHPAIEPLISAEWDQTEPYNLTCPSISGEQCVTGCVATAMAQALYKVRPEGCRSIEKKGNAPNSLPATTFNWSIMRDSYADNDQSESAQEVAKLMRYCGQAATMTYSTSASTSYNSFAADALKKYFNISNSCHIVERQFCLSSTWDETIYNELQNQRPVIMSGANASEEIGHEFVCDGYDGSGKYHINWGWSGISNGYFYINALNPDAQGTGGSNGGYSSEVEAIIGLKNKDANETQENISVLTLGDIEILSNTAKMDNKGNLTLNIKTIVFYMNDVDNRNFEYCWGVFDANDNLVGNSSISLNTFENANFYEKYSFPGYIIERANFTGLSEGTYYLKHISRQQGSQTWCLSNNADFFVIKVVIKGKNVTLTPPAMNGNNEDYQLNDISITGNGLVGAQQTMQMTVKNTGDTFSGIIYVAEKNGNYLTLCGSIAVNIDPGQTETLTSEIILNTAGTHTLTFYKQANNGYLPLAGSCTYTVSNPSYTTLTVSGKPATPYTVEDGVYIINQSNLQMECKIENATNDLYHSYILYWMNTYDNHYAVINMVDAKVLANTTVTAIHNVKELNENETYCFIIGYFTSDEYTSPLYSDDRIFIKYKNTATDIDAISDPATPADDAIYTLDGRRVSGSAPLHGIYIKGGKKIAF